MQVRLCICICGGTYHTLVSPPSSANQSTPEKLLNSIGALNIIIIVLRDLILSMAASGSRPACRAAFRHLHDVILSINAVSGLYRVTHRQRHAVCCTTPLSSLMSSLPR